MTGNGINWVKVQANLIIPLKTYKILDEVHNLYKY